MRCVSCGQAIADPPPAGCCPLCGADLLAGRSRRTQLTIVVGAMFAAIPAYAALVAMLHFTGFAPPVGPQREMQGLLVVLAGLVLAVAAFARRKLLFRREAGAVRTAVIVGAAAWDSLAVLGLLPYYLYGDMKTFAAFAGCAALGFVYLLATLPTYVALMDRYAAQEGETPAGPGDGPTP